MLQNKSNFSADLKLISDSFTFCEFNYDKYVPRVHANWISNQGPQHTISVQLLKQIHTANLPLEDSPACFLRQCGKAFLSSLILWLPLCLQLPWRHRQHYLLSCYFVLPTPHSFLSSPSILLPFRFFSSSPSDYLSL